MGREKTEGHHIHGGRPHKNPAAYIMRAPKMSPRCGGISYVQKGKPRVKFDQICVYSQVSIRVPEVYTQKTAPRVYFQYTASRAALEHISMRA